MPFFNNESTLIDAIRSVFAQGFDDWELILLDDGSTDSSLDIAHAIKDERVRVFSEGVNKGIGARRKEIVDRAVGQQLAWLDADDMMHPDRLAIQRRYLEENASCGLVDSWTYLIDTENKVVGISRLAKLDLSMEKVVRGPCMLNGSTLGRIELYRENEYDATFRRAEDWEMCIRAYRNYQFGRISQPLYFRRCVQAGGRLFELKALRSLAYSRRVLLKHGPSHIGWPATLLQVTEDYARALVRVGLSALGLQGLRPGARSKVISSEEFQCATEAMNRVMDAKVPGIDV